MQVPFIEVADADINYINDKGEHEDVGPNDGAVHKGNLYFCADDELYPGVIKTAGYKGIYAKTGVGQLVKTSYKKEYCDSVNTVNIGTTEKPVYETQYTYNFLYAVVNVSSVDDYPSIATMNGFTEITPGQIRAYMFSSPDGGSYLDLKNSKFKLGNDLMFENGSLSLKGGLLAGLVAVRDAKNNVVAGLNGSDGAEINGEKISLIDSDHGKIMMFAGAKNDPKNGKTVIYEDGHLKTESIEATGGVVGGFSLTDYSLTSGEQTTGEMLLTKDLIRFWSDSVGSQHDGTAKVLIGKNTIPGTSGGAVGCFRIEVNANTGKYNRSENYGIMIDVAGSKGGNYAISASNGVFAGFRPMTKVLSVSSEISKM